MGYLFKGSFIFAEETFQKWFLVLDYLEALKVSRSTLTRVTACRNWWQEGTTDAVRSEFAVPVLSLELGVVIARRIVYPINAH